MNVVTPIREEDIEFDHGSFDAAAFARRPRQLAGPGRGDRSHPAQAGSHRRADRKSLRRGYPVPLRLRHGQPDMGLYRRQRALSTGIPVGATIGFLLAPPWLLPCAGGCRLARLGVREWICDPHRYLKSGNRQAVEHTIHAAATVAHHHGALLKVILETACLRGGKLRGAEIAIQAGADFIKTSTGFHRRRHRCRRCPAARRSRCPLRRQGRGRYSHPGGRTFPA